MGHGHEEEDDTMRDEPDVRKPLPSVTKPLPSKGWRGRSSVRRFLKRLESARERELERVRIEQGVERLAAAIECRPARRIKPKLGKLDRLITKCKRRLE